MKRFVRHIAMSLIAGLICLQGSVSAQESQSVYPGGQVTMLSTGSVKTVSYTHLDVYKRQAL